MASGHERFQFSVDGALQGAADKIMTGRQIREAAGKTPASEFVLVQIVNGSARSIGLEDEVKFAEGGTTVFLSFRSDRVFNFTVDERGWEWGDVSVAVADIYRYAAIDPDLELVLDSAGDRVLGREERIELAGSGVERIRSREPKTVTIKVNGRPRIVEKRRHTYQAIAALAYPDPDFSKFNYTITYLHGVGGAEGDLVEGESIQVRNGMVFNVRRSDKS